METSSSLGRFNIPAIVNEPFTSYGPGSPEKEHLTNALKQLELIAPCKVLPHINGEDVDDPVTERQPIPFKHATSLAEYPNSSPILVKRAIEGALKAKKAWSRTSLHDRAAIFLRAATLLQTHYKYKMMAATMLGQGKNPYQADIDCVAESIDFLKIFPVLAEGLYQTQPPFNGTGVWNRTEVRPIDGFVYAISPFNFTALAVNLVLAPLIVGNVVIWKPSPGAIYSSWLFNQIMIEAGLPAGVLQFVPGDPEVVTNAVYDSRDLGGLHFTGSTSVFRKLVSRLGDRMDFWRSYPRVVGETGGKNFHLIHSTADITSAAMKSLRAGFEYQGQKCSALSRIYVAASVADRFKSILVAETQKISVGSAITDFMGPVISKSAFERVTAYIDQAREDADVEILAGGSYDDSVGWFMKEEIFGPFVCLYVFEDSEWGPNLFDIIDSTSEYALSGAVFAKNRTAIIEATEALRFAAGNFYINDQCTGAMPGHQPFGGSRASGTNDKAGSSGLLTRFVSQRTIKENFATIDSFLYPSNMTE